MSNDTDIDQHDDAYWGAKVRIATQGHNDVDLATLSVCASRCLIGLAARMNAESASVTFVDQYDDATIDGKPVGDWVITIRKKRQRK